MELRFGAVGFTQILGPKTVSLISAMHSVGLLNMADRTQSNEAGSSLAELLTRCCDNAESDTARPLCWTVVVALVWVYGLIMHSRYHVFEPLSLLNKQLND